jgi:beta-phosphoglucomutase family hydrolase
MTVLGAVIWDMDGVLVDTGEFHFQSWVATLPEYGIEFSREDFRTTFGMNNEGILRLFLGERFTKDLYTEISDRKERNFRKTIRGKVQLFTGVLTLLKALRHANISQAVGSSAPYENIDAIVRELKLSPYFQTLVSAVGMPSKPDPSVFLTAAAKLGTPPGDCLVVEDAIAGVEAAHRAGMKCVAVTTTNPASALQRADVIIDHLDNISVADLMDLFT